MLRISGTGQPLLAPQDMQIDVLLADGSWLPVRGVCSMTIRMDPEHLVTADITFEPSIVDLAGLPVLQLKTPTRWERARQRWRSWAARRRFERHMQLNRKTEAEKHAAELQRMLDAERAECRRQITARIGLEAEIQRLGKSR